MKKSRLAILGGDPVRTRPFPPYNPIGEEERKAELERMLGGQEFLAAVRG